MIKLARLCFEFLEENDVHSTCLDKLVIRTEVDALLL